MRDFHKLFLVSFFTVCSTLGFLVKLPRVFHHFDKELHAIFYFIATMILSFLFPKRWLLVIIGLALFGIIIEFAQEFSNKITMRIIGKSIHGRYDIEDVKFNLIGLLLGLFVFLGFRLLIKSKK